MNPTVDKPVLLLLPGLLCDDTVWRDQRASLTEFECVVPCYGLADSIGEMARIALSATVASPLAVVGHSMGGLVAVTALAHDKRPWTRVVRAVVTLGSPLGLDEVQDCLEPEWTRSDGYPANHLQGPWVNFFDPLDVVCGADPKLANDFRNAGQARVRDAQVANAGWWRHSLVKYFGQPELRRTLRELLEI